jgi:hypothetical protein
MKKTGKIFIIGISVSILVSCFSTEHYLIKDFEFYGAEQINLMEIQDENKIFRNVYDTLKNKLFFRIEAVAEYQYGYLKNLSLIKNCYATSVPKKIDNYIILDFLELRLDSDIYFGTDIIEKNTDLWNHPKLKDYRWYHVSKIDIGYSAVIGFIDSFYDKVNISPAEHTIEMVCPTSDNQKLTKSIKLFIDL